MLQQTGSGEDQEHRSNTKKVDLLAAPASSRKTGRVLLEAEKQIYLLVRGFSDSISLVLSNKAAVVGRTDPDTQWKPAVPLDNYSAIDAGVSRQHVALIWEDQIVKVTDLSSFNGTYLNGQQLVSHQPRILRDGDELRLGNLFLRIYFG